MTCRVVNQRTGEVAAEFATNGDNAELAVELAKKLAADTGQTWVVVATVFVARPGDAEHDEQ
jgi:hypothetical protein